MKAASILIPAFLAITGDAFACDCGGDKATIAAAFTASSEVFLAQAISIAHVRLSEDPNDAFELAEIVAFRVLEVWKGPLNPGDVIQVQAWRGPGECNLRAAEWSIYTKPFELAERTRIAPVRPPGKWVIYRSREKGLYELSACSRTRDFANGGAEEADALRKLSREPRER